MKERYPTKLEIVEEEREQVEGLNAEKEASLDKTSQASPLTSPSAEISERTPLEVSPKIEQSKQGNLEKATVDLKAQVVVPLDISEKVRPSKPKRAR